MLANPAVMVVAPLVYDKPGYDAQRDFKPVSLVSRYKFALAVAADSCATWPACARSCATIPGCSRWACPPPAACRIFALMLGRAINQEPEIVGYRGSAPLISELIGGVLPQAIDTLDTLLPQHRAGKIRILATSGEARDPDLPDVPTFREAGVDLTADGWNAFFAPAAMPADKAERLGRDIAAVLDEPALREARATWNRCRPTPPAAPRRWTPTASSGSRWCARPASRPRNKDRGRHGRRPECAVHHGRPAAGRPPRLLRSSLPGDAQPGRAGGARALHARLRQLRGVRPVAHELHTGRYPSRHGATWNRAPLSVNEITLGEYLAGQGRDLALAGKTHVIPDKAGMERLAIDGASELGILLNRGGFVELDRYDGHHEPGAESGYPAFLRRHGYDSADPWTDYVIAGVDASGQVVSGWNMRNVHLPSRVAEAHSETAYMTDQALDFMKRRGGQPWVLHLSYVKPHWPYMAPDPYHRRYRADQCLPVRRNLAELENAHPVVAAYRQHEESISFANDDCVRVVRPAYQGRSGSWTTIWDACSTTWKARA